MVQADALTRINTGLHCESAIEYGEECVNTFQIKHVSGGNGLERALEKIFRTAVSKFALIRANEQRQTVSAADDRSIGIEQAAALMQKNTCRSGRQVGTEICTCSSYFRMAADLVTKEKEFQREQGELLLAAVAAATGTAEVLLVPLRDR